MTSNKQAPASVKISDARNCQTSTRVSILAFTGRKDATDLDDAERLNSEKSEADEDSDLEHQNEQVKQQETKETTSDCRYLMPAHMPQYLRID